MAKTDVLHVALVTQGTRGDFQPMLALAMGLRTAGHQVHVFANPGHCETAEKFGFEASIIAPEVKDILESEAGKQAMDSGDLATAFRALKDDEESDWPKTFSEAIKPFPVDLVVWTPLVGAIMERFYLEYPDVPTLAAAYQPSVISNEIAPVALFRVEMEEGQPVLTKWQMMMQWQCQNMWDALQAAKKEGRELPSCVGPELAFMEMCDWSEHYQPMLLPYSAAFWPPPSDFPKDGIQILGRWQISKQDQEQTARGGSDYFDAGSELGKCAEFIKAGPVPVYIGWGSMTCKSKEHMAVLAADSLRIAGQRGIIVSGWADVNSDSLAAAENAAELQSYCQDNILFMKSAPHEWLFPQCSACVHHGGIGTTQASLAAGSPTIVTPVFADQFDVASVVERSGWGVGTCPLPKLTPSVLGTAIKKVVSDKSFKDKTVELAGRMAKEDGVKTTVDFLESFMRDEVRSGKWKDKKDAYNAKATAWRKKNEKLPLEAIMYSFNNELSKRYPPLREWTTKTMVVFEKLALAAQAGKLFYVKGTSVLARSGKELKSSEVGRYKEFAFLELVDQVKSRLHVKRLKGVGPAEGWVTAEVAGKEIISKVAAAEVGKIEAERYKKMFSDIL